MQFLLQVRPALIGVQDIDALCELVDILRLEVRGANEERPAAWSA